jgi:hypothetical protein
MFGDIIVALHFSRVEVPLLLNAQLISEWLGILDIVLSSQTDYLKLLNLELNIIPLPPSSVSLEFVNGLNSFASSLSILKRNATYKILIPQIPQK